MGNDNHIRAWRDLKGVTQEDLADKTGFSVSYISRMESGDRNVSLRNLRRIAEALDVPVFRLVSGVDVDPPPPLTPRPPMPPGPRPPTPPRPPGLNRLPPQEAFGMARVDGAVQAGAYLQVEMFEEDQEAEYVSAPKDPDFPFARQVAYRVNGDSMNDADRPIREGDFVVCALFEDLGLEITDLDGEIVVVQQTIADGQLRERSLKELRDFPDRVEYHPRTDNPIHKPIVVPKDTDPAETRQVEVIALHRFTFEGRPRPMRKRPR